MKDIVKKLFSDMNNEKLEKLINSTIIDLDNPKLIVSDSGSIKLSDKIIYLSKLSSNTPEKYFILDTGELYELEEDDLIITVNKNISISLQEFLNYIERSNYGSFIEILTVQSQSRLETNIKTNLGEYSRIYYYSGIDLINYFKVRFGFDLFYLEKPKINENTTVMYKERRITKLPISIVFGRSSCTDYFMIDNKTVNTYYLPLKCYIDNIILLPEVIAEVVIEESKKLNKIFDVEFIPEINSICYKKDYKNNKNDILNEINYYIEKKL